jgi:hypothetical protein
MTQPVQAALVPLDLPVTTQQPNVSAAGVAEAFRAALSLAVGRGMPITPNGAATVKEGATDGRAALRRAAPSTGRAPSPVGVTDGETSALRVTELVTSQADGATSTVAGEEGVTTVADEYATLSAGDPAVDFVAGDLMASLAPAEPPAPVDVARSQADGVADPVVRDRELWIQNAPVPGVEGPADRAAPSNPAAAIDLARRPTVSGPGQPERAPSDGTGRPSSTSSTPFDPRALNAAPALKEALKTASATATVFPGEIVPALRERLDRVVDRMARDFGYTVEVVEAHRTQERQDALFAQGRTAPGPVVTWTRESRHTAGAAVDVRIDGGWSDAQAFLRLAHVARDEGLRTLWPRDPGHIELAPETVTSTGVPPAARSSRSLGGDTTRVIASDIVPADVTPRNRLPTADLGIAAVDSARRDVPADNGGVARPAQVAEVAAVATVARPAMVAVVAEPGRAPEARPATGKSKARTESPAGQSSLRARVEALTLAGVQPVETPSAPPRPDVIATVRVTPPMPDATTAGSGGRSRDSDGEREAAAAMAEAIVRQADGDLAGTVFRQDEGRTPGRVEGVKAAEVFGTDTTERIARVLRLQESAVDRPLSSVLLRLDGPDGSQDRIRVGLRGTSVEATLDIRDSAAADQMRQHSGELQRALERQGLEGEAITIRSMTRSTESAAGTAAAGEREAIRAGTLANGQQQASTGREGGNRAQTRHEDTRREADDSRPRERRQPKGDR